MLGASAKQLSDDTALCRSVVQRGKVKWPLGPANPN